MNWLKPNLIGRRRAATLLWTLAVFNLAYAAALIWIAYFSPPPDAFGGAAAVPDFAAFWAAGTLSLDGTPALAYDWIAHKAVQTKELGHDFPSWMPWHYPPPFQLAVTPFAMAPLWAAMAIWSGLGLALYLWVCWRILPDPVALAGALAAAPTALTLVNGQTGFLTASILGFSLLALDRRPVRAGVLLGLLSIKPHLALAIPFAMAAGGRWRAFAVAVLTIAAVAALAWVLLGGDTWRAFVNSLGQTVGVFQSSEAAVGRWEVFANLYGSGRYFGFSASLSLLGQTVLAIVILVPTVVVWRSPHSPHEIKAALLCFATAAVTPRVMGYDLHILVIGALFQTRHALRAGFFPGEQLLLATAAFGASLSMLFAPGVTAALAPALFLGCWLGREHKARAP